MDDSTSSKEDMKSIKEQIEALKTQHKEEEIARRKALHEQMSAFMQQQRKEDQAHKKAVQERIEALKKQFVEEHGESKQGLREKIAGKVLGMQEDHNKMHQSRDFGFFQDRGDSEIKKGFLKMHILLFLKSGPTHGYEIMHRISHHTGHMWRPSPGSLYPALDGLESKGFITCQGDGRRKVYSLTSKGQEVLVQMDKKRQEQLLDMKAFMSSLLEE